MSQHCRSRWEENQKLKIFKLEGKSERVCKKTQESEEVRVGQWIETSVICKIKGGFFVPEMREIEEEIEIVLRAYGVV